jgi:hypothetical protein
MNGSTELADKQSPVAVIDNMFVLYRLALGVTEQTELAFLALGYVEEPAHRYVTILGDAKLVNGVVHHWLKGGGAVIILTNRNEPAYRRLDVGSAGTSFEGFLDNRGLLDRYPRGVYIRVLHLHTSASFGTRLETGGFVFAGRGNEH